MKFLFDPVYTNRPRICSTSYLVWELIEELIKWRPDTYHYVLYPPNKMQEEDWQFVNRYPRRVKMLPLVQCTSDRVSELHMLRNELRFYMNPWCEHTWDADVVVSSRMPMIRHYKQHSARPMGKALPSLRMFVGLEEMPILQHRNTVPWADSEYADTLVGYGLTDATLVNHTWMKQEMRGALREVFSPAWQKRIMDRVHEVYPVKLGPLNLKDEMYQEGQFNVVFVGRVTGTRNFKGVAELFRNQFSFPLGKNRQHLEFKISTNSESMGAGNYGEIDFMDWQWNDREAFHQFLAGAHVAVNMSTVEDFSLSTYETLKAGVPIIVDNRPWTDFLGPSYPFRVDSMTEAHAMVSAFAADYTKQYAKFRKWHDLHWVSIYNGSTNVTTAEKLISLVQEFVERRRTTLLERGTGGAFQEHLSTVPSIGGCINLTQWIKENGRMFKEVEPHFSLPLGKVPITLMMKMMAEQIGYQDTWKTGVMQR